MTFITSLPPFTVLRGKCKSHVIFCSLTSGTEKPQSDITQGGCQHSRLHPSINSNFLVQDPGEIFYFLIARTLVTQKQQSRKQTHTMAFPIQGPRLPSWSITVTGPLGTETIQLCTQQAFAGASVSTSTWLRCTPHCRLVPWGTSWMPRESLVQVTCPRLAC